MKKVLTFVLLFTLLSSMSLAMELKGKTGVGLRGSSFSVRKFISNNFAVDASVDYSSSTQTGVADSNYYGYSVGGLFAKEVFQDVLLEAGATLQGWSGFSAGTSYTGFSINPFVGAECFINEHFSVDGKVFIGYYGSEMTGTSRWTGTSLLNGNLGAHIYL